MDNENYIKRLELISTSTIADVLDGMNYFNPIDDSIKNINHSSKRMVGIAYTVAWRIIRKSQSIKKAQKSTWEQVKDFLATNYKGENNAIYVAGCDNGLLKGLALAGGMSCLDFYKRGFKGVVLGGDVRDAEDLFKIDIPIFSSGFTPYDTQGSYEVYSTGNKCNIGHAEIETGDFIVADSTGLISIPKNMIDDVLYSCEDIEKIEKTMKEKLKNNEDCLYNIVNSIGRI